MYFDEVYTDLVRLLGYSPIFYCDLIKKLEPLELKYGKQRVHSATYHTVTFEGQMTKAPRKDRKKDKTA